MKLPPPPILWDYVKNWTENRERNSEIKVKDIYMQPPFMLGMFKDQFLIIQVHGNSQGEEWGGGHPFR